MVTLSSLVMAAAKEHGPRCALRTCVCSVDGKDKCRAQDGITYENLMVMVQEVVEILKKHGVKNGTGVAMIAQFIPPIVCSIISVMEAGGAVMPLDECSFIGWGVDALKRAGINLLLWPSEKELDGSIGHRRLENLVIFGQKFSLWSLEIEPHIYEDRGIAVILCTSGSTGTPKIVEISHACFLPNIHDFKKEFQVNEEDVTLPVHALTFDMSSFDIFLTLSSGACLVLFNHALFIQFNTLKNAMIDHSVSFLSVTPSLFNGVIEEGLLIKDSPLKSAVLCGEICLTPKQIAKYREEGNTTKLYNAYGMTEQACISTYGLIPEIGEEAPIGNPSSETVLKVLDDEGREIEEGQGELVLSSDTRVCYINQGKPSLEIITGDLVEIKNGDMYYRGRKDNVMNRMGYRVLLDGISAVALEHVSVGKAASVGLCGVHVGLFVVPSIHSTIDTGSLREFLKERLPHYWLPTVIIVKTGLPLSAHGKTNKRALQAELEDYITNKLFASKSSVSEKLAASWKFCLSTTREPESADNFISCGGDSLRAASLDNMLRDSLNAKLPSLLEILVTKTYQDVLDFVLETQDSFSSKLTNSSLVIKAPKVETAS